MTFGLLENDKILAICPFTYESVKRKNLLLLSLLIFCFFVTIKYHLRFNEGRKFHDLSSTDLSKSIPAEKIDKKLSGLNWISPEYKNSVEEEINLVVNIKNHLSTDKRKKMVITHYSFLSTIGSKTFEIDARFYTFQI